ncbi:MAG: tetratricopeptide repeat protein [Deltaproteobacteria bacterium]|nr:tetratricopeptide repeat protein [Deltaproteobacteria bacterium]
MQVRRDAPLKSALSDLARVQEYIDKDEFEEAKELLERVRSWCSRHKIRSAHVSWLLAIVCDYLDDLPAAVGHVEDALEVDPVSPSFHRSFEIVTERIRRALCDEHRKPDDPETPRLYELLLRLGEADVPSHLAMARFHVRQGDSSAAFRVLDAVTVLSPGHRDAWLLKAVVARSLGEEELAREADLEAANLAHPMPVAFPVREMARG